MNNMEKTMEERAVVNIGGEGGNVDAVIAGALENFKEEYLKEKLKI